MTAEMVLENLQTLVGNPYPNEKELTDDIIYKFEDFEENEETQVIVSDSHNADYDLIAYINTEDASMFLLTTNYNWDEDGNKTDITITNVFVG